MQSLRIYKKMHYINNKDTVITSIQQGLEKLGQYTSLQKKIMQMLFAQSTNQQRFEHGLTHF